MKKLLFLLLILALPVVSGCQTKTAGEKFIVTDQLGSQSPTSLRYTIMFDAPSDSVQAVYSAADSDRTLYESAKGDYYIATEVCAGRSAEQVIKEMTGFSPEELGVLKTNRLSMTEYQFSWCTSGEEGTLVCTGAVLEDADYCYSIQFCAQEESSRDCAAEREQVMSSFSLSYDEGF